MNDLDNNGMIENNEDNKDNQIMENKDVSEQNITAGYNVGIDQESNENKDRYDDLKTSTFYNESYKKPGKGRLKGLIAPLLVVALISSILTGGIVASYFTFILPGSSGGTNQQNSGSNGAVPENTGVKQVEIVNNTESPVVAIAEKVGPSIVGINVNYVYSDMFFGNQNGGDQGSGIIFKSDGYIITNNHVIESAMESGTSNQISKGSTIEVILPNQKDKPYKATVIGRDAKTDIAVLKIEASELPAVEFGDSDQVKVGEMAIAIGNPAGLEFMGSVTGGYISGLNRTITFDDGKSMKLIQTDAAINPGNSGGALLNSKGQVIGVNSSKMGGTGYEGLGFAIPSNLAKSVADSLVSNGYVAGRPQLGITVDTRFNNDVADQNKVPHGILVSDVTPLSGAFKAGIKSGDIITKVNNVAVTTFDELETQKNLNKPGDTISIELYRMPEKGNPEDGTYKTVQVTLGEDKG